MTFEPGQQPPVQPPAEVQPQPQPAWAQPAQQPVWAQPVRQIQWRQSEPLEYHQLLRGTPRYRWWKPLVGLLLGTLYYLTFQVAFTLPVMAIYAVVRGDEFTADTLLELATLDTQNPWSVFLLLTSVALMIPAVWLAMLSVGLTPVGRGWSVALRIRWSWIWRTLPMAFVAMIVTYAVGMGLAVLFAGMDGSAGDAVEGSTGIDLRLGMLSLLLAVLLVPLQATAEELVFRGAFMQSIGAWLGAVRGPGGFARFMRGPWLPILVPALAFGFAHIYDIWGFLQVTVMAIACGWLAWRTGGLEAAISLHVVNNLVVFVFMSFGAGGQTAQTSGDGAPNGLIGFLLGALLYCWWVDRSFQRRDGRRTRIDYVQVSA